MNTIKANMKWDMERMERTIQQRKTIDDITDAEAIRIIEIINTVDTTPEVKLMWIKSFTLNRIPVLTMLEVLKNYL